MPNLIYSLSDEELACYFAALSSANAELRFRVSAVIEGIDNLMQYSSHQPPGYFQRLVDEYRAEQEARELTSNAHTLGEVSP